ncbi:TetR family transcriptional regulator [Mycolicibacterium anyangense]|uniref:TetR family transcriptional regulator n=1 Tax=Mycolicibacterium anyangense TaxID=1431246 RepID=A0A6N4W4R7_9MYCO|nr:TetR/AcrR family transcriptional regulator [Mycolicibacterium anyangense]BBZ76930.1 TetR family transcriptional regulator [Mycolicibacterium anyangense]
MARPPEFDRAQALVRALHLFWEKGYERTTVRDLTEVMGISAPSLYNSFGGKKELFDEAVAQYASAPSRVIPPALEERRARDVFAKILDIAVREYSGLGHPAGCFVISDPVLREERESGRRAIRERLCTAQRDGDLAADADVDALSDYIDIVLRGMSSLARDGADTAALRAAADVALRAWPRMPGRTTGR